MNDLLGIAQFVDNVNVIMMLLHNVCFGLQDFTWNIYSD